MEEETWKTIPISLKYEASTHGRIRNKATEQILKSFNALGYRRVGIKGTFGEEITNLVHRLVAITFIPNPENKATVNHKRGRSNNKVSNLEWLTHREQIEYSRKRRLDTDEVNFKDTWGDRNVWQCDQVTGQKIAMFDNIREAASAVLAPKQGMSHIFTVAENHEISSSISGSRQSRLTAAGFKWEFGELREFVAEDWLDVDPVDAKGAQLYQISTLGRLCDHTGTVKSPFGPGYSQHSLGGELFFAHRLVALTHLPRIEGKSFVNHLDGNKNNPSVDNLAWVTLSENARHAHDTGLIVPPTSRILQFDLKGNYLQTFDSVKQAKEQYGQINVHRSINTNSAAGGYIWKHETDEADRVVKLKPFNHRYKEVRQFDMNCTYIRSFRSIQHAQKQVPGLQLNAASKGGSSAGYRWKYATDTSSFKKITRNHNKKKINQYDLDMNFIALHESITSARTKLPGVNISWSAKHSKPSKGFYWKYA